MHGRELPWRVVDSSGNCDPYRVLVSELMLQQTQVARVIPKFEELIRRFPSLDDLSQAQLADVLRLWSGLGYNRRAKYLHDAARSLTGPPTWSIERLENCKGIGSNTAAAIMTYAYNQPFVFIETNIRTVYILHYFATTEQVSDKQLSLVVERTIDKEHPREWYWALMDYGTYLKRQRIKTAVQSRHYVRQSAFNGSNRQLRGRVMRVLAERNFTADELKRDFTDERLAQVLQQLHTEGLVVMDGDTVRLP